jgi:hypothetical protein
MDLTNFVTFAMIFILLLKSIPQGMTKYLLGFLSFFFLNNILSAQIAKKRLPQIINVPTYSHIFPSLSGDGNQMIYLTNYTNNDGFETRFTYRTGTNSWADPEPIPSINRPTLDHIGSFCLSYDGNFVVFSSRRSPGIGNYDIWISEKIGNNWSQPKNPGKPLNSTAHEGNPSLSPDGKSIYFMRCESMDNSNKRNCSLFVSHRLSPSKWSAPEPLPDHINTGHETTPRILADNKTLIFASARPGGKGMMDLYSSTLKHGEWSNPRSLSFINSEQNDEFITVPARGDIIYFSGEYRDQHNIYMGAIPEEFRPEKVLMLTGNISYSDGENPADDVIVQAFDVNTGAVYTTARLNHDNSYTLFLPEGASYDVSAFPQKGGHTYQSQIIDLMQMPISRKEELSMELKSLRTGITIPLTTIRYEDYTSELTSKSDVEIKRIIGFLKKNPGTRVEIGAFIDVIYTDSIPSNDLTEIIADTVFFEIRIEEELTPDEVFEDSLLNNTNAKVFDKDSIQLQADELIHSGSGHEDNLTIATLISEKDSLLNAGFELLTSSEDLETYYKVKYTYHNDRTPDQAEALLNKLIEAGVPAHLIEAKGYGDDWTEDRASEERNYWIELKILPL